MKINLKTLFKNSFCITISQYRYNLFNYIFSKSHINYGKPVLQPNLFNGYIPNNCPAALGCTLSHLNLMKMAKELDLPYILVYEDDAYPCENVIPKLKDIIKQIPKDADFVVLGYVALVPTRSKYLKPDYFDSLFVKLDQQLIYSIHGSQAYIIFKSAYDKYINYLESDLMGVTTDCKIYFNVGNCYVLNYPLYIQYTETMSFHGAIGYRYVERIQDFPYYKQKLEFKTPDGYFKCDIPEIKTGVVDDYYFAIRQDFDENSQYVKLDCRDCENVKFKSFVKTLPETTDDYLDGDIIYNQIDNKPYILRDNKWQLIVKNNFGKILLEKDIKEKEEKRQKNTIFFKILKH